MPVTQPMRRWRGSRRTGVRSARVVELQQPSTVQFLRVAKAEPLLVARLTGLKPEVLGKPFLPCESTP